MAGAFNAGKSGGEMTAANFKSMLKFSESGVRGVIGAGMTPRLAAVLCAAFGSYKGQGCVVIGRDTRPSGVMLADAAAAGLLAVGCQVIDLGIVPTPTVQLMVRELGANGGIAVTASHNPAEWNALKFIGSSGTFLDRAEVHELFEVFSQGNFEYVSEGGLREVEYFSGAFQRHAEKIFQTVDTAAIARKKLRVAVDCCNGAGALWSELFLKRLGCTVFAVNSEPDGRFRRMPEPLPENLAELADTVVREKCDIGFAQDPDGDRLTLVDDRGRRLNPQLTVALVLEHVLEAFPGPVAVNLQTTHLAERIARESGGEIFYSPVGEINVVQKMRECGANIGGEGNCGGVIWKRVQPGRDSYSAMALLLELLALSGEKLSDIVDAMPPCFMLSEKIAMSARMACMVLEVMRRKYAADNPVTLDGIRLNFPDGWMLARSSNTEPVLRVTVESEDADTCRKRLKKYTGEIESIVAALKGAEE